MAKHARKIADCPVPGDFQGKKFPWMETTVQGLPEGWRVRVPKYWLDADGVTVREATKEQRQRVMQIGMGGYGFPQTSADKLHTILEGFAASETAPTIVAKLAQAQVAARGSLSTPTDEAFDIL